MLLSCLTRFDFTIFHASIIRRSSDFKVTRLLFFQTFKMLHLDSRTPQAQGAVLCAGRMVASF